MSSNMTLTSSRSHHHRNKKVLDCLKTILTNWEHLLFTTEEVLNILINLYMKEMDECQNRSGRSEHSTLREAQITPEYNQNNLKLNVQNQEDLNMIKESEKKEKCQIIQEMHQNQLMLNLENKEENIEKTVKKKDKKHKESKARMSIDTQCSSKSSSSSSKSGPKSAEIKVYLEKLELITEYFTGLRSRLCYETLISRKNSKRYKELVKEVITVIEKVEKLNLIQCTRP